MLIKKTKEMTDSEQIAVDNSNFSYLEYLCAEAKALVESIADHPVEVGTVEVGNVTWTYEKMNSGIIKMHCMVAVTYSTAYLLEKSGISFPFEFTEDAIGFVTINEWSSVNTANYTKSANILCKTNRCSVQVHESKGGFTSGTSLNVAVYVIGKWK